MSEAVAFDQADLRRALERFDIAPRLQPIVAVRDFRVVGFEALARWEDPARGVVLPDLFLPAVIAAGMALEFDCAMLRQTARVGSLWRQSGRFAGAMHVNLLDQSLADPDLAERLAEAVAHVAVTDLRVVLEITEAAAWQPGAPDRLAALKRRGFELALDNVESVAAIRAAGALPLDMLKLHRSLFVERPGYGLAEAVAERAAAARECGFGLVAVGVESAAHWAAVSAAHIDLAQGYGMAMPLDVASAALYAVSNHQRGLLAPEDAPA